MLAFAGSPADYDDVDRYAGAMLVGEWMRRQDAVIEGQKAIVKAIHNTNTLLRALGKRGM